MPVLFASDLDNTLIRSYKNAGTGDICVEVMDGKKLSFMSRDAYHLLQTLSGMCTFAPVTTRSLEQYRRIELGFTPQYAAAANGALLVASGELDAEWTNETRRRMNTVLSLAAVSTVEANPFLYDIRYVDDFFIFAKSDCPARAAKCLREAAGETGFAVYAVHNKVYLFPSGLDKGTAVTRLKERLKADVLICAGDSEIDIPMLQAADIAVYPSTLALRRDRALVLDEKVFTSEVLSAVMRCL